MQKEHKFITLRCSRNSGMIHIHFISVTSCVVKSVTHEYQKCLPLRQNFMNTNGALDGFFAKSLFLPLPKVGFKKKWFLLNGMWRYFLYPIFRWCGPRSWITTLANWVNPYYTGEGRAGINSSVRDKMFSSPLEDPLAKPEATNIRNQTV